MTAPELIAHWPLGTDARDALGNHHGVAHKVAFGTTAGVSAASFNGLDSRVDVADHPAIRLCNHDFTIAASVRCAKPMTGVFGDILSKFDAEHRCGVNLWIAGSAPGYNAMSDTRHVYFGTDDGYTSDWEDCGRPWPSNPLVPTLTVFKGELYGGLSDAEQPMDACRVFRWVGGKEWVDCGRLGNDPDHLSVMSMLVHDGALYAGTGLWDWGRAGEMTASVPPRAITRVFRYEGGKEWRDLGQVGKAARVLTMASFNGELYAGLDRGGGGGCFKLSGDKWVDCGVLADRDNFECLFPHGGVLYGASHFAVFRYEGGTTWKCIGRNPHGITQIHSMHVYNGRLYIGTWPQGFVLRLEEDGRWTNTGRIGIPEGDGLPEINEINALVTHNGKLYAGVLPKAQVYRYERDGQWTLMGSLASNPKYDVKICPTWSRVVSLTTHRDRLFAATGSSQARTIDLDPALTNGRVLACRVGHVVGHEQDLGGEWTHIAAVREGNTQRLYINGKLASESLAPAGQAFDLANPDPLRIGFGTTGAFSGAIADVRMYRGVFDANAVRALAGGK